MPIEPVSPDDTDLCNTEQEKQTGRLHGREVQVQQHLDNAKKHLKNFVLSPVKAAAHVITNPTYVGVAEAAKIVGENHHNLIDACKEYNEAKRIENKKEKAERIAEKLKKRFNHCSPSF